MYSYDYGFVQLDQQTQDTVMITKHGIDFLDDVLEAMLQFLQASGYTYVKKLIVVKDNGEEMGTL